MATLSAQGAGAKQAQARASKSQPDAWWVMGYSVGLFSGTQTAFQVFGPVTASQAQADVARYARVGNIPQNQVSLSGPFATRADAQAAVTSGRGLTQPTGQAHAVSDLPTVGGPSSWLASIGGALASGLEAGFVQLLKDLWNVVEGPVLIIIGVVVAVVALSIYFRAEIASVASTVTMAAA